MTTHTTQKSVAKIFSDILRDKLRLDQNNQIVYMNTVTHYLDMSWQTEVMENVSLQNKMII